MNAKSQQVVNTSQNQNTSGQTNPWAPQQPYLLAGFNGAQTALGQATANNPIPQNFTAGYSPDQVAQFQQMVQYGGNNPQIAQSSANAGGILNAAGAGAAQTGLSKLATYTPGGGTQSNIDAANAYASGQQITPLVDAAMRDANREASEFTLPGVDRSAAASGNVNSSKDAIAKGIVDRGLAEKAGDISAQLRQGAYTTGLQLGEQNSEATNNNNLAGILGLTNSGAGAVNAGVNAGTGAVGQQGGLYNILQSGITGEQAAKQAPLTNASQVFQANATYPFLPYQQYLPLIQGNYGSSYNSNTNGTGTQTTTSSPSTLAQIGGWTNLIGSLL